MALDQTLVDAAIGLVKSRFPDQDWAGAAAVRLDDGQILTSTAPEFTNAGVGLCHETEALCAAYRLDRQVRASVCVMRADRDRGYWILTPCGVCQERLFSYGPDVEVAVPEPGDPSRWRARRLREVQPYWWGRVLPDAGWPY